MDKRNERRVLWVEGPNDQHVVLALLKKYNLLKELRDAIEPTDGIDNIFKKLRLELKKQDEDGLERIGIIVDADNDINARWASLRDRLRQSGYDSCPDTPEPNGTIIEQQSRPMIGIWIMPDNTHPGMLEDFITFLVPRDDKLWKKADHCLKQLEAESLDLFSPTHRKKALMHTWLAWQKEPGKPMGQAITANYLKADAPHAGTLVAWLRRLFALDMPEGLEGES